MPFTSASTLFPRAVSVSGTNTSARLGLQVLGSATPTTATDPAVATVPIGVDPNGRVRSVNSAVSTSWFPAVVPRYQGIATIADSATTATVNLGTLVPNFANAAVLTGVATLTGAPSTTAVRASFSGDTLTLTADAAPGAGTSVAVSYAIF